MTTPIYRVKADFFKVLGHPARIRVLELLRDGEHSVGDLVPAVGIESSHLSQQLGIMRRANLVQTRKEGSMVYYSVGDRTLYELLDVARTMISTSLSVSKDLLDELRAEGNDVTGVGSGPAGKK